jgi:hypothetical protein
MNINIKKMNKFLPLILIGVFFLSGCTADDPAYVYDTDPIDIEGTVNTIFPSGTTDITTGAVITIEYEHYEIHEGDHYYISGFETEATGANVTFGILSPDSPIQCHVTIDVFGTSQTELYLYEGSVYVGGVAVTPVNNNRNSATTSTLVIAKDPAITSYGTQIYRQSSGLAGVTPAKSDLNSLHDRNREIILKRNTAYTVVIVSRDDDNIISYIAEWYEE